MNDDDLIYFDDEDDESVQHLSDDEDLNIFDLEEFNEETISSLIDEVHNSLDAIEDIIMGMYFSYGEMQTKYEDRINTLEVENEKYREEIKKLYQELASNSKKKKEGKK